MGFPKPWPTEWPQPDDPSINPDRDNPDTERETEDPVEIPEDRHAFRSVTWAVNHACNLRCTHCYDVLPFHRSDLSTVDALRVIDHLDHGGVTFIAFSGGEAFLRGDLLQLMEECKRRGIGFGARSNGTRITPRIAAKLKNLGISVVGVSFDGAIRETHDAVRGTGSFDAAVTGLLALRDAGVRAHLEVVLSRQNARESELFAALGESLGASEVNFSAMTPQGRGAQRQSDLLNHDEWLQLTSALRKISLTSNIPISPNCAFTGPCVANIEPHVTCDGWMSPCYLSVAKLFNVLEVPADSMRVRLESLRHQFIDVCGRKLWTESPNRGGYSLPVLQS